MKVADVMTQAVLAVDADTPLEQAIRLMTTHHISGVPVIGANGKVVGILTEGDLLRRVESGTEGAKSSWLARFFLPGREAATYIQTHGRRVSEVMTSELISITEDTELSEAVQLMQRHHVKRLPVLRDGKLVGIVSRADVVRLVGDALAKETEVSASDTMMLKAIYQAMDREPWAPSNMVSVAVKDGVAELDGCLFDFRAREALGVLVENVPGIRKVENRIVCIEPTSGMIVYDPIA